MSLEGVSTCFSGKKSVRIGMVSTMVEKLIDAYLFGQLHVQQMSQSCDSIISWKYTIYITILYIHQYINLHMFFLHITRCYI